MSESAMRFLCFVNRLLTSWRTLHDVRSGLTVFRLNFHGLVPFIFYIKCLKKAFVKGNYWLMNIPAPAGERPHPPSRRYGATSRPLERLVPNPKLKFMEQCREVMRFHGL
jgi:hypothetical protein